MITNSYNTKEGACLTDTGEVGMGRGAGPLPPLPPQRRPVSSTYAPSEPVWEAEANEQYVMPQRDYRRFVPAEMQLILPKLEEPESELWADDEQLEIAEPQEPDEEDVEDEDEQFYGDLANEQADDDTDKPFIPLELELSTKEYLGEGGAVQDDKEEEFAGEFEDAEWSDAEDYGYSTNFPYKKKKPLVNKEEVLPKYVAPKDELKPEDDSSDLEFEPEDTEDISSRKSRTSEGDPMQRKSQRGSRDSKDETRSLRGSKDETQPPRGSKDETKPPRGSKDETRSPRGSKDETQQPRGSKDETRSPRGSKDETKPPRGSKDGTEPPRDSKGLFDEHGERIFPLAYIYNGDSEMDTMVETSILNVDTAGNFIPLTFDKATQVSSAEIEEEYRRIEEEGLTAEELAFRLRRIPSLQADAEILVRPIGYKQLELSAPLEAVTFEASTQVTEQLMDEEWAMERGVLLSKGDILWPTVAEFVMENVARRLYDYIAQCWNLDPKWMYYVHPVQSFTDNLKKRVTFEVKFSVPTPQIPIPQATASVFFIFEMSHYAPREEVVKVHYVVEGTRFRHTPGSIPFQDKWLWSVISNKVRLQRSIAF